MHKIVLVEDEKYLNNLIKAYLEKTGYEVICYLNGQEAINNKIILYNDGENIEENVLNNIFTPYEKGVKGIFGLGLTIENVKTV